MLLRALPAAVVCAAMIPTTAGAAATPLSLTRIAGTTPPAAVDPETPQAEIAAYRGPEGIAFVPASDSPSGVPLLLVTNETTSTIGVWQVTPAG